MANLRDIKRRIRSVKNTGKITKAMQLVAASKMRKAQAAAVQGRSYAKLMATILKDVLRPLDDEQRAALSHPLLEQRQVKHRGILLISTDKGLCGALNANLFRLVARETDRETCRFVTIGRKATQFVSRTGRQLTADFTVSDKTAFSEIRPLLDFLMEQFSKGEIDTIEVFHSEFINNLRQEPIRKPLVPLDNLEELIAELGKVGDGGESPEVSEDTREPVFEPAPDCILEELLPRFTRQLITQMILESKASEHSARMVAMKTATDNSKKLADRLTLDYNKARQAAITQEILEITAAQQAQTV
jgi:F-type H+-transporting ATPase subunit gamma